MNRFDIAVIGGGPGGYPAAIRAAQLGKSVALIEADKLGGTCLNRGCIPSKALIACGEVLHRLKQAEEFGIHIENLSFDYEKMVERKDRVVEKIRSGLKTLIHANKIKQFCGFGKFIDPNTIRIKGSDNLEIYAEKIIIATGSEPREMAAFPFDRKRVHDSTSLLEMTQLPKKLVIIGGGIIGCEFASLYKELGVEVIILEALDRLVPLECEAVSSALSRAFSKQKISIETKAFVEKIETKQDRVFVQLASGKVHESDIALVATGRRLNTSNIGLEKAGVAVLPNGMIEVNAHMETNVPGIYAVGDIASKWWLAHVASHQGLVAGSHAAGRSMKMSYQAIPSVIFTNPEIATVGYSLEDALKNGFNAQASAFPFIALGKSQAAYQTEGFAQIIVDCKTTQILGAQVVGHDAGTLIAEMALAIANELTLDCITHTIHAHPTLAESWLEAALVAAKEPLHIISKQKMSNNGSK